MKGRALLCNVGGIVARNIATDWCSCARIELFGNGFGNGTANRFKIDVNALRAGCLQRAIKIYCFIINTFIEAELIFNIRAFFRTTSDTDDMKSKSFTNLTRYRPNCARGGRDHKSFAGHRFTFALEAKISGSARHAADTKVGREGDDLWVYFISHGVFLVRHKVLLPTRAAANIVTYGILR